ncbi:pseudaminic acid synthase [Kordiimonas pumila]|uniref:Pseudaminic acid synthase n=1 Tax=Kordiimonas pumila TaxID=2161677 RepID=A0ABV7D0I9_9PROT|nr:pseudaminic acid synthase [Kordiimonas pumila]
MPESYSISNRTINAIEPPYIIAEISGNHMGSLETAFELIKAAHSAGADAVKFQTYEAHTITLDSDAEAFIVHENLWKGERLYNLYKKAQTPFAWHQALFAKAAEIGIPAFSAPFDATAVDLLQSLSCPAYKIASCELVDIPLLQKVAATNMPLILSTGMATEAEVDEAIATLKEAGADTIALLHCISGYPTPHHEANLQTLPALRAKYNLPIGISDHSMGIAVPVAATALGAVIIEKHLCLSRQSDAVDRAFSLEPHEFADMVRACREAHSALGKVQIGPVASESDSLRFRRSLYITRNLKKGDVLDATAVRSVRPAGGLHTRYLKDVMGQKIRETVKAGTPLSWNLIEEAERVGTKE